MLQPRKTAHLSDLVQQHLNMCTLAASAAGVSLLALAQLAQAKIVYTPPAGITLTGPSADSSVTMGNPPPKTVHQKFSLGGENQ